MTKRPVITLLTDFGTKDHYVAAMKGSVLSVCPEAQLVDVTHQVQPYVFCEAAYLLSQMWCDFPLGTIHIVVVDPGVGSGRRPILVETGGHYFVGPDNGVFGMVLEGRLDWSARHITVESYFRAEVSRTFHGRDLFAPVAGHLAAGVPAAEFGGAVTDLVFPASLTPTQSADGGWRGVVLHVDRFGNIVTNLPWKDFGILATQPFEMRVGNLTTHQYYPTYSSAGSENTFLLRGSGGYVEASLNQRDAAKAANVHAGSPLEFRFKASD